MTDAKNLYINDVLVTEVVLTTATKISDYAFIGCNSLTSIKFSDTSTWYITDSWVDCENKIGGTGISVAYPASNATYFKSTYDNYYWYKR